MGKIILPLPKPKIPVLVLPTKRKAKRRTKAEWLAKFEAVPCEKTAEESELQRPLFHRHGSDSFSIRLPMPPTVNKYWRNITIRGQSRTLISAEGRAYKVIVAKLWKVHFFRHETLTGSLRVHATVCYGDRRRIDLDNRTKALLDSLTEAGAWKDDSQIDDLRVIRGPVDPSGRGYCDVIIETIGE